jgi:GT2 family glycosyltransferase
MLNVSIVLYNNKLDEISSLVQNLRKSKVVAEIYLIDNSPVRLSEFESLPAKYIFNNKNIGYGSAHNIALRQTIERNVSYHLVLNPDISFEPNILENILGFMNNNSEIGQLMPKVYYPNNEIQYLCKLIPTPFDLIIRRFLPASWVRKRTEKFEMRATGYSQIMDVPYLSGCFMFLRTNALKEIGLFDERFFMYPEDIDLTRRIHRKYRTVFYPEVSIIHHHSQESYTNLRMLWIHTINMIKYYNKWGWIFDKERKEVNRKISQQFNNQ